MSRVTVSIIIPVYNVKDYVSNTIDSILGQTYGDFELILVNDGSTDGSGGICDAYAKKDSRIRVFHKENSGSSDSRNLGIDMAKGDYILFVDADDFMASDMLDALIVSMSNDVDVVSCGYVAVSDYGNLGKAVSTGTGDTKILSAESALEDMMYQRAITNTPWGKLYRKSLFEGVRFPSGKINQDLGTIYKLLGPSRAVAVVDKSMYMYMYRPDSVVNSKFAPKRMAGLHFAYEQLEYVSEKFPGVISAAHDRLFMEAVFILRNFKSKDIFRFHDEYRELGRAVKSMRSFVFVDRKVAVQHKVSALASYLGIWTIIATGYFIRSTRRVQRSFSKESTT